MLPPKILRDIPQCHVLLVVHPDGVSTWCTEDIATAYRPCFGPRPWEDTLKLLPPVTSTRVRLEADATAWPCGLDPTINAQPVRSPAPATRLSEGQ